MGENRRHRGLVRLLRCLRAKAQSFLGGEFSQDAVASIPIVKLRLDLGDFGTRFAGVREKQARDFILRHDTQEHIALLAITIAVMRWLIVGLLFHSAPQLTDSMRSIFPICPVAHSL